MSAAAALVRELEARGATIGIVDGKLAIDAPEGVLTANWVTSLEKYKAEIMEVVGKRDWRPWWSDRLTVAENASVDEFMCYPPDEFVADKDWESGPVGIEPCTACGCLPAWWDGWGNKRCLKCDPPLQAIRLLKRKRELTGGGHDDH